MCNIDVCQLPELSNFRWNAICERRHIDFIEREDFEFCTCVRAWCSSVDIRECSSRCSSDFSCDINDIYIDDSVDILVKT